jgi:hypothetical protein
MDKKLVLTLLIVFLLFAAPVNAAIKACTACNSTCNTLPGMNGTNGTDGVNGVNGTSATISVNYTGTLNAGNPAAVYNIGDSTNAIFDFFIPKGDKGDTGSPGAPGADGAANMTMNQTMNQTPGATGATGGTGGQVLFFHHEASSDPGSYEQLQPIPAGSAEDDESISVGAGAGTVLVDAYVTDPGYPGITTLPAGLWRFRTFHYVDNLGGLTQAQFNVYNRTAGGTETLLFSADSDDINAGSATEYLTSYVQTSNYNVLASDRLVIKVYGKSDSEASKQFHFVYEGTNHTSHVQTPLETISSLYVRIDGSTPFTGKQSMGGFNLTNLLDPVAAQDAATKFYLDAVNTSQTANTSIYVIAVNNSMKAYVDAKPAGGDTTQFLFLNGSRPMTGGLQMGGFNISNLLDPVAAQEAATKAYVDAVNTSMRNNVSINFPSVSFVNAVNDSMRNNVSQYVIAVNDSMRVNVSLNNNTQTINTSQYVIAVNNTQNVNVSLVNTSMRNNVSAYVIAVNTSMNNNISVGYAPLVAGKVPTTNLGGAGADSTKFLRGDQTWQSPGAGTGDGNTYHLIGLSYSPADNGVNYFGATPTAATTSANLSPVWFYKSGTITGVTVTSYAGTAGTGETWGMYLWVNNTVEYPLQNVTVAGNTRVWRNSTISVPVVNGSFIQIKTRNPAWGTNPLTCTYGAYVTVT